MQNVDAARKQFGILAKVACVMLALFLLTLAASESAVHDKAWEHFGLLNELRAEGFTCPNGQSYAANPTPLNFDCRLWKAAKLHSEEPFERLLKTDLVVDPVLKRICFKGILIPVVFQRLMFCSKSFS